MKNIEIPPKIRKAVFPVAGLGTRFLPGTKAAPKEMLNVVDKPIIQYAVEEAYAAGIRHMIFVTGRSKRAIEDHFDTAYELENELEAAGKTALLEVVRSVKPDDMQVTYVRQPRALGLGHAVLCAEPLVGKEPFAVLLADDLMTGLDGGPNVLAQMVQAYENSGASILAVQEVPLAHVSRYGIVAGKALDEHTTLVERMVEKPRAEDAPSRLAVAGRYILSDSIFDDLRNLSKGVGGEIRLMETIANFLKREPVHTTPIVGGVMTAGARGGFLRPRWSWRSSIRRWVISSVAI